MSTISDLSFCIHPKYSQFLVHELRLSPVVKQDKSIKVGGLFLWGSKLQAASGKDEFSSQKRALLIENMNLPGYAPLR
ncbi:hypothetical protein [Anabaena azotica]|uniref:Uncharacterized protein n=1 Tax=Anabaena azotica FACHB-119 TaxID=947527 RepID=A0ABR8CXH9_9NOST|nr:hypothetical protein [Anabaena azotica]MBD2499645.1 hypothetical protein [Anabaena azotica FACHB-119]